MFKNNIMRIRKVDVKCINDENKNKFFVYGIKNNNTGKYYIGSTINKRGIHFRIARHIYGLKTNTHHSEKLQRSFNKYNSDFNNWEFSLLEEITKENHQVREQFYINKFNAYYNGYNSTPLAGITNSGAMSDKHKKAISDSKQNLLDSDIIDIFSKYNSGLNYSNISKFYDLSYVTISTIINNDKYYPEVKEKYSLKKEWYNYIFYNLNENKFYKVYNFAKFCAEYNLNDKMMMPLYLGKFKFTFINNWTVFNKENFSLSELRKRIKINEGKDFILYKDDVEYHFKNVKEFCKKNKLDETSVYHVLNGSKESIKGFGLNIVSYK